MTTDSSEEYFGKITLTEWKSSPDERDLGANSRSASLQSRKREPIKVRYPEPQEWQDIKRLVVRHHSRTRFGRMPFSNEKYEALEKEAKLLQAHQCLLIAEFRGNVVGVAWFSAGEYVLSDEGNLKTIHLLAVDVEYCKGYISTKVFIKLVSAIRIWSRSRNSLGVIISVTTEANASVSDRVICSIGGITLGGNYVIAVE